MIVAYVGMGLPTAALGVAWKSMRADFDRPLSSLGLVVITFTVGYLAATGTHRVVAARMGPGALLTSASAVAAGGALAFAVTGSWLVLLAGAALLGLSAGNVDTALNAQVALHHSGRLMNLMHGGFGLGATLGPLVMTALLGAGVSWRWGYGALGLLQVALVVGFAVTARQWPATPADLAGQVVVPVELGEVELGPIHLDPVVAGVDAGIDGGIDGAVAVSAGWRPDVATRQRRAAWLGPLVFLAYGAAEVAIGSWAFVLLTGRGVGTAAAGISVTLYWGALAVGRLGLGAAGPRISPAQVLAGSVVGAVVGGVGLWVLPTLGASGALILLGLSLAGMFPALMALTPARVGPARTRTVISNQLAASVVGGAAWSAAVGLVAQHLGSAAIAPALLASCLLLAVTDVVLTSAST
jgi:fucose permease